jgi:uncharacterized membrane protein
MPDQDRASTPSQITNGPLGQRPGPFVRNLRHLGAIFLQGLITLLPLIVTVVIIGWLGFTAERTLGAAIKWVLPTSLVHLYVPGMGVAVGALGIFLFGLFINVYGVPKLIQWGELAIINRVPLVKTIYGGVRDLLGFFSQPGSESSVSKVVVVKLGDTGIRAVGLLTRETFDDLPEGLGEAGYVLVYFPFSYQMGGPTMLVPRENVTPLNMPL